MTALELESEKRDGTLPSPVPQLDSKLPFILDEDLMEYRAAESLCGFPNILNVWKTRKSSIQFDPKNRNTVTTGQSSNRQMH